MFAVDKFEAFDAFNAFEPCFFEFGQIIFKIVLIEHFFMSFDGCLVFFVKIIQDVTYPKSVAADFVSVSRSDALACCANFAVSFGGFVGCIEQTMGRKNEVGFF